MKIIAIACVENKEPIKAEIAKQTIQPTETAILTDENPAKGINERRKRIAENQEALRKIVELSDADYVWQVEGDCVLPENCLERLVGRAIQLDDKDFGYISGIQVGRHGLYCIGAWHIGEDEFSSVDHTAKGILEVDATGFYCLLAPRDVWLKGKASWQDEPYGPDVVWGLSIPKKKYVDMGLEIGHQIKGGIISPSDPSTTTARFYKTEKGWEYKTV